MSGQGQKPSFGDVVSAAGLTIGLVTAWLYVAGWEYAYSYFDRFRIPLLMLDFPLEHFLVYGGLVVRNDFWIALTCAAVLVALLFAVARGSARLGRFWMTAVLVLIILVAFALARSAGRSVALADFAEQRSSDYSAYPRVRVTWEGAENAAEAIAADLVKANCARLLAASASRLFLIRPVRGAPSLDLDTFVLSAEKTILRIEADYTSCP
jgi:hypothetical protein